jgi:hypothetical protein
MLVDAPLVKLDELSSNILSIIGGGHEATADAVDQGLYVIHHFSFDMLMPRHVCDQYPELHFSVATEYHGEVENTILNCYGVCDSPAQFMEVAGQHLRDDIRKFVVSFTPILKSEQSSEGGWRWHKWGPYIGNQKRSGCEYLYDEPNIEKVYAYHVYEIL